MITYEEIRKNEDIRTYIQSADEALAALGFTEHSFAHVTKVAESVKYILETLGFSAHAVELGMIAHICTISAIWSTARSIRRAAR